jgi:integrase
VIGSKPLIKVTTDDIEDLYLDRERAGMAPKGIELLHTMIHAALKQAATRGKVLRNAADGATRPKVRRVAPDVYDDGQLQALLDAAEGHALGGLVALLATTSLRHGELLDLRWRDIDLDRRRIVLANPEKDGKPRTIPMTGRAVRMLRAHRVRQHEKRLARAARGRTSTTCSPTAGAPAATSRGTASSSTRCPPRTACPR